MIGSVLMHDELRGPRFATPQFHIAQTSEMFYGLRCPPGRPSGTSTSTTGQGQIASTSSRMAFRGRADWCYATRTETEQVDAMHVLRELGASECSGAHR
ncbi:hypothetical protein PAXRUDRAFT_832950 [Paxillus rubicundulus Ve08.2h10]|uniref:Uncharacterized protein n=1 Tax=Paxillus rubicundulus Ve08.2h10 TaxID=930991 RepID=A0A0D0CEZ1_9AGAM|nr:hypothetical protein PAXRUDRAFT_832950 [Paxillus rubicundulus Ve08.2h10]